VSANGDNGAGAEECGTISQGPNTEEEKTKARTSTESSRGEEGKELIKTQEKKKENSPPIERKRKTYEDQPAGKGTE